MHIGADPLKWSEASQAVSCQMRQGQAADGRCQMTERIAVEISPSFGVGKGADAQTIENDQHYPFSCAQFGHTDRSVSPSWNFRTAALCSFKVLEK